MFKSEFSANKECHHIEFSDSMCGSDELKAKMDFESASGLQAWPWSSILEGISRPVFLKLVAERTVAWCDVWWKVHWSSRGEPFPVCVRWPSSWWLLRTRAGSTCLTRQKCTRAGSEWSSLFCCCFFLGGRKFSNKPDLIHFKKQQAPCVMYSPYGGYIVGFFFSDFDSLCK